MRAGLAILTAVVVASPAHAACRLHAIWHFPWKQRCPVYALAKQPPPRRPHWPVSRVEILLPDLANIEWGQAVELPPEALGRWMLRAKMEDR